MHTKEIGKRGEDAAAAYLERSGLTILCRNWRCKSGEIDIIALDEDVLVLVEVKTRRGCRMGMPEEAVSWRKQRRITRLAETYLSSKGAGDLSVRFDVIAIQVVAEDRAILRHQRSAFIVE